MNMDRYRTGVLNIQSGLQLDRGHWGHCLGAPTNGLGALEINLLFCYSLTCNGLGALLKWPGNGCPLKFVIRALHTISWWCHNSMTEIKLVNKGLWNGLRTGMRVCIILMVSELYGHSSQCRCRTVWKYDLDDVKLSDWKLSQWMRGLWNGLRTRMRVCIIWMVSELYGHSSQCRCRTVWKYDLDDVKLSDWKLSQWMRGLWNGLRTRMRVCIIWMMSDVDMDIAHNADAEPWFWKYHLDNAILHDWNKIG